MLWKKVNTLQFTFAVENLLFWQEYPLWMKMESAFMTNLWNRTSLSPITGQSFSEHVTFLHLNLILFVNTLTPDSLTKFWKFICNFDRSWLYFLAPEHKETFNKGGGGGKKWQNSVHVSSCWMPPNWILVQVKSLIKIDLWGRVQDSNFWNTSRRHREGWQFWKSKKRGCWNSEEQNHSRSFDSVWSCIIENCPWRYSIYVRTISS